MRIIAQSTLRDFWTRFPDAEQPLRAWHSEVERADWSCPQDVKNQYVTASIVANNRVVFNIHGNRYRLVVAIKYAVRIVYIRFIGTHRQYDNIDVTTV